MYKINKSLTEYLTAIKLALANLGYNKMRTALSVTGIVIGVMAVIIVLSAGLGMKKYILGQIDSFGGDIVDVQVKVPDTTLTSTENAGGVAMGAPITTFKLKQAETLAKNPNVQAWYALAMIQENVSWMDENKTSFIMGTSSGFYQADPQAKIDQGEVFTKEDDDALAQVIVLGSKLKNDLFGTQEAVGQSVKIRGKSYKVIGVLQPRGSTGFFDFDTLSYIPIKTVMKKIQGVDYITEAVFKVKDAKLMDQTAVEMRYEMRRLHDISEERKEDFGVMSMNEARETINKVFSIINLLLIALTFISLLVGGVGIMNVMYVAVAERTYEIGLRKAVGASSDNIRHQFLFEAMVITFLGALLGIVLGSGLMVIISQVAAKFNFNLGIVISLPAILLSSSFSVITGLIFGYYPARRAAQLTPLEALRK